MAVLIGMKDICDYLNRSEATVTKLLKEYPTFPAEKIGGGMWESDTELIDEWRKKILRRRMEKS